MADNPSWSLSDDKTTARVDFPTDPPCRFELQAEELDDLIATLAAMRRNMVPEIPMSDLDQGSRLEVATVGRWYVEPNPKDKSLALALLHPGYRWVAIRLDYQSAADLRNLIDRNLPQ